VVVPPWQRSCNIMAIFLAKTLHNLPCIVNLIYFKNPVLRSRMIVHSEIFRDDPKSLHSHCCMNNGFVFISNLRLLPIKKTSSTYDNIITSLQFPQLYMPASEISCLKPISIRLYWQLYSKQVMPGFNPYNAF